MGKVQRESWRGVRDSDDGKIWTRWEFQAIAVLIVEYEVRDRKMDRVAPF